MSEKEPIKIKLSTAILIFIILILIAVIIAMNIYYNSNESKNIKEMEKDKSIVEVENNVQNVINKAETSEIVENNAQNVTSKTETGEIVDLEYELITELYEKYIPIRYDENCTVYENAYQSKKVTLDDLDSRIILRTAIENLDIKESDKKPFIDEKGNVIQGWYAIDAQLLQNQVKKMYGKEVENQSFGDSAQGWIYKDGLYKWSSGGAIGEHGANIRNIIKAYKDAENIYIEDKCLYYEESLTTLEANLYTSSDRVKLIKKWNYDNAEELVKTNINIKRDYKDDMITYKHTFKKAEDGSYYWYSTEPVE